MSDEFSFNGEDDAKAEIRAAVRYLLKGGAGSDRGDIVSDHCHCEPGCAQRRPRSLR
jgi:hypothetical protein